VKFGKYKDPAVVSIWASNVFEVLRIVKIVLMVVKATLMDEDVKLFIVDLNLMCVDDTDS